MNLVFLGDSLMHENGEDTYPQTGWPQGIKKYLKDGIGILDFAENGRSTKSFLHEGIFEKALESVRPGDVCFISFGHNDEKIQDSTRYTDPFTSFEKNLCYMSNELCSKSSKVVLLSPVSRLKYDADGNLLHTHGDYPKAIMEIAKKTKRSFVDLEKLTYDDLSSHTRKENEKHYMILKPGEFENYPQGKEDTTHVRVEGADWVCSLLVPELKKIDELKDVFR